MKVARTCCATTILIVIVSIILQSFIGQSIIDYSLGKFEEHKEGVVLISGTSTGIGRHATFELASKGYTVFCSVRKEGDIESLKKEAQQKKLVDKVHPILMDVIKIEEIENAVTVIYAFLKEKNLPFVGLVNNAGISSRAPVEAYLPNLVRDTFDVNFFGALNLTQKFIPLIREYKGRIIFISSMSAIATLEGSGIYSASKRAIEALVDSLRLEMKPLGVSVTSILPGYVKTPIQEKSIFNSDEPSKDHYLIYKNYYDNYKTERNKNFENSPSTECTSEAIVHALTSPYPKTRYYIGYTGEYSPTMVSTLISILPDRIGDLMKEKRANKK